MSFIYCLFIIYSLINLIVTENCDKSEDFKSTNEKIQEEVFCNYNKDIRPIYQKNQTEVNIYFQPEEIQFNDVSSSMILKTWIKLYYRDEKLSWDPKKYNNVEYIAVDPNFIWVPDLMLYNWVDENPFLENVDNSFVGHNGMILTSLKVLLKGHCVPNYTDWPFDQHSCEFSLLSKQYFGHELDFSLLSFNQIKAIAMSLFVPHPDWELIKYSVNRNRKNFTTATNEESYSVSLSLLFTVKRHASVLVMSYLIPAFATIIMSNSIFQLDPNSSHRLLIICALLLLQCMFLQYLSYQIHSNGNATPKIVIFYSISVLLSTVAFSVTILSRLIKTWTSHPMWLRSVTSLVLSNRIVQFIFLTNSDLKDTAALVESGEDEGLTLVSESDGSQQWCMFIEVMNKFAAVITLCIYVLLFLHFIS